MKEKRQNYYKWITEMLEDLVENEHQAMGNNASSIEILEFVYKFLVRTIYR